MKLLIKVKAWWEVLPDKKKSLLLNIGNYALHAFAISFFIYCVMSIWMQHSIFRAIATFFCSMIGLYYFEYYYVWLRRDWDQ